MELLTSVTVSVIMAYCLSPRSTFRILRQSVKQTEAPANDSRQPAKEALAELRFDHRGLIPAIAQDHLSGEVLMMAWMNADSIAETLQTGRVCYWSRSRGQYWRKGETSGNVQRLKEMRIDCDSDTLLLLVEQQGPACHTGRRSCFFNALRGTDIEVIGDPPLDT